MATHRKSAFTLVELLVVITIIGLLAAIALPAISSAREAARRAQCMSNIRELIKGIDNFETRKDKYPASFSDSPTDPPGDPSNPSVATHVYDGLVFPWTWVPAILPYIGEDALYDQLLDFPRLKALPTSDKRETCQGTVYINGVMKPCTINPNETNLVENQRYIELLNCPSSLKQKIDAPLTYSPNMGWPDRFVVTGSAVAASDGPLGGVFGTASTHGIFHDRYSYPDFTVTPTVSRRTTPTVTVSRTDIEDGASYTVMLSENVDAREWTDTDSIRGEYATGIVWTPCRGRNANPNNPCAGAGGTLVNPNRDIDLNFGMAPDADYARPSSRHQNGFMVGFSDSTVKFISEEISYLTYRQIMSIDDSSSIWDSNSSGTLDTSDSALNFGKKFDPIDLEP